MSGGLCSLQARAYYHGLRVYPRGFFSIPDLSGLDWQGDVHSMSKSAKFFVPLRPF